MHKTNLNNSHDPSPLLTKPSPNQISGNHEFLRQIMLTTTSWLRMRRSRCIFLLLCSPILLPFLFATFPILCAIELCIRICRRGKDFEDDEIRRCEEGFSGCCRNNNEEEIGLLQRYLDDQLRLVGSVVVVYDCGEIDAYDDQFDNFEEFTNCRINSDNLDFKTPLLS